MVTFAYWSKKFREWSFLVFRIQSLVEQHYCYLGRFCFVESIHGISIYIAFGCPPLVVSCILPSQTITKVYQKAHREFFGIVSCKTCGMSSYVDLQKRDYSSMPAIEALVKSYTRWHEEWRRVSFYDFTWDLYGMDLDTYAAHELLPPAPKVIKFLFNLPSVKLSDIPGEDRQCVICHGDYCEVKEDGEIETPKRLPCGHIMGNECIRKWLVPFGNSKSCPVCRTECTSESQVRSVEESEIHTDEVAWADHLGARPLDGEARARVRNDRYRIVIQRFTAATNALLQYLSSTVRDGGDNRGDQPACSKAEAVEYAELVSRISRIIYQTHNVLSTDTTQLDTPPLVGGLIVDAIMNDTTDDPHTEPGESITLEEDESMD